MQICSCEKAWTRGRREVPVSFQPPSPLASRTPNPVRYGYVCTGEAFIFLCIPRDDPTIVYYLVCVPKLAVMADDGERRLHRTAIAQIFAFIIQALPAEPPSQE